MGMNGRVKILQARWTIIMAALIVGIALGLVAIALVPEESSNEEPTSYSATSLLLVTAGREDPEAIGVDGLASIVETDRVAERVATTLDLDGDPSDLLDQIEPTVTREAGTLGITATAPSAGEAESLADAFATELIGYINDRDADNAGEQLERMSGRLDSLSRQIAALEGRIDEEGPSDLLEAEKNAKVFAYGSLQQQYETLLTSAGLDPGVEFVQDAVAAPQESSAAAGSVRSPLILLLVPVVLSLLLGAALALIVERVRPPIRTRQEAERHFGAPVLAEIPRMSQDERASVAIVVKPAAPPAEAFRLLEASIARTSMSNGQGRDGRPSKAKPVPPRTLLITSPGRDEGKTTVVANLAAAYAEQGTKVVVLSCDLRQPTIHRLFGAPNEHGLTEALRSGDIAAALRDHGEQTDVPGVLLVPSGPAPANPGELLSSDSMRRLLAAALQHADVVLIDTTPILDVADAAHLIPEVDVVLLVARSGKTLVEAAERTTKLLKLLRAPVVGLVLNGSRGSMLKRSYRAARPEPPTRPLDEPAEEASDAVDDDWEEATVDDAEENEDDAARSPDAGAMGISPTSVSR